MASKTCGGFKFDGTMSVDTVLRPIEPEKYITQPTVTGRAQYGTLRHRANMIQILPPKIVFNSEVNASGSGNIRNWQVVYLQAAIDANWGAHYSNNNSIQWRFNMTHGVLNDCQSDGYLHMRHARDFSGVAPEYNVTYGDGDEIAQLFFKEYSGDPFDPSGTASRGTLERLERTEGKICFRTYLAVMNESEKTVVTLHECHWSVNWNGNYDFATGKWTADNINAILEHQPHDRAETYEHLKGDSQTPFSLYLEKASRSWEVQTPDGWIPWRDCQAIRNPVDLPTWEKWVK